MLAIEKFAAADIAFQGHSTDSRSLQTTLFSTVGTCFYQRSLLASRD